MKTIQVNEFELDLFFRIDLEDLRPYNAYGMTSEDFKKRHKKLWETYNLPNEYKYIFSYVRLKDLNKGIDCYLKYLKELFRWENHRELSMEQVIGIISKNKLLFIICDESDLLRPWIKQISLINLFLQKNQMEANYNHSVWGCRSNDKTIVFQENDELFNEDDERILYHLEYKIIKEKLKLLTHEIKQFFEVYNKRLLQTIPIDKQKLYSNYFTTSDV